MVEIDLIEKMGIVRNRPEWVYEKAENFNHKSPHRLKIKDILKVIQNEDPDIVDRIEQEYNARMGMYQQSINNPVVNELKGEVTQLRSMLEGKTKEQQSEENSKIVKEWESGLGEVQSQYATKLRHLGVKPNWEQVQKVWVDGAGSNMSVKQALFAVHGDEMSKALESKQKLVETKAKSNLRTGGVGREK